MKTLDKQIKNLEKQILKELESRIDRFQKSIISEIDKNKRIGIKRGGNRGNSSIKTIREIIQERRSKQCDKLD